MNKHFIKVILITIALIVFKFDESKAQCNNIFTFTAAATPATCLTADGNIAISGVTGGSGNYTFSLLGGPFSPPALPPNDHAFTGLSAGVYNFTISDGTCDTTVSITIAITASITSASANANPTSCTGNTGSISVAHQPAAVSVVDYILSPPPPPPAPANNATGIFNNLPAGTYSVILTDANGCPFTINGIEVGAPNPITDADILVTPIQCKGALGSIKVNGVTGGSAPYKYSLNGSTPLSISTFNDLFQGPYTVTVTDNNNCTYQESVVMQGSLTELKDCKAGTDTSIFFGENVQLNAFKGAGTKFFWTPGNLLSDSTLLSPIATPLTTTTYSFTTKTAEGCTCVDRVTVTVVPIIKIPNTFTPNQDGTNDIWIIENTNLYDNVELTVYNRWGDKVYFVKDYKPGNEWDGGSLPVATYYYVLRFKYPDGIKIYEYTGGITIIR
jgi:gliding motility-associated-like protein